MKHVAVFFDAPGFDDYPFNDTDYRPAYHEFAGEIAKKGGVFSVVRSQSTHLGGNQFSGGWTFSNGAFEHVDAPLDVDVIYNKGYFKPDEKSVMINEPALDRLCTDKWETYVRFPEWSPHTAVVNNAEELRYALEKIVGDKAVAKPLDGEEGKGVVIGTPEEVTAKVTNFPYLIQAFIDTSRGIPGIIEGHHDLRVVSVNGEPVVSYVRTPPPGKLTANVAQGGTQIEIDVARLPSDVIELFRGVDERLQSFKKRIYSVDAGLNHDGRWKIIELNAKPGLTPRRLGPAHVHYQEVLADLLLS